MNWGYLILFVWGMAAGVSIMWGLAIMEADTDAAVLENLTNCKSTRGMDGLYLGNWNETRVKEYTKGIDPRGDWVCVNVRGMEYERAVEVCNHEVGHEIFAEICESKPELCFNVVTEIERRDY